LSKNPLDNITNTKSIEIAFRGKYLLTKDDIVQILDAVLQKNEESRTIDIQEFV